MKSKNNDSVEVLIVGEDTTFNISAEVNASFTNLGGFYKAIDREGTVIDPVSNEEIAIGEEGYEAAAVANSVIELGDGESTTVDLDSDFVYVPYLLANGIRFFSSFAEANVDGLDHVQSISENSFGFEDLLGGGDNDFNDFVITAEVI